MRQTDAFARKSDAFGRQTDGYAKLNNLSPRYSSNPAKSLGERGEYVNMYNSNQQTFGAKTLDEESSDVKAMRDQSRALLDSISKKNSETKAMIEKMNSGKKETRYA